MPPVPRLPHPAIFDILIIGSGPTGLNAALTCARIRTSALVFDSLTYRNAGVLHMHSVASRDHFNPREFGRIAREQIESRYDTVWFQQATITHAVKKEKLEISGMAAGTYDGFEVKDSNGHVYLGRKIILATGSRDTVPSDDVIPGYGDNWPAHIYQCLACDGYEKRGTAVGILDFNKPMYAHMVQMATAFEPSSITIFSNGPVSTDEEVQKALKLARAFGATLDERKIARLVNEGEGEEDGVTVHFEEGGSVRLGFLVHEPGTVNRAQHLIEQLGVETVEPAMGGQIKIVNPMFNETSVAIAMSEGMKAAAGAGMQLAQEKAEVVLKEYEAREKEKAEAASS